LRSSAVTGNLLSEYGGNSAKELVAMIPTSAADSVKWLLPDFTARQLANIIWAIARLGQLMRGHRRAAWDTVLFADAIAQRAKEFNMQELSMVAWALSSGLTDTSTDTLELQQTTHEPVKGSVSTSSSQQTVTALKVIARQARMLTRENSHRKKADKAEYTEAAAYSLATLVHSLVRAGVATKLTLKSLGRGVSRCAKRKELNCHDLANISWAYARSQHACPKLMATIARAAHRCVKATGGSMGGRHSVKNRLGLFEPRQLSVLLWALAKQNVHCPKLLLASSRIIRDNTQLFNARDLATLSWAFAVLSQRSKATNPRPRPKLFAALATAACQRIDQFNAQELSKFLWSYQKSGGGGVQCDKMLDSTVAQRRELKYDFGTWCPAVTLVSVPGGAGAVRGRRLRNTGLAAWEASFVLAEWLSRNQTPACDCAPIAQTIPKNWGCLQKKTCVELGAGL